MCESLAAHCTAINDFKEFLGEDSISKLLANGYSVEFSLQISGNKLHFVYQVDGLTYPHSPALLLCTTQETLNLELLNAKLSQGVNLGEALSLLGR